MRAAAQAGCVVWRCRVAHRGRGALLGGGLCRRYSSDSAEKSTKIPVKSPIIIVDTDVEDEH